MGVIKDGSISGVLPTTKVFAVNYPGYPSSIERAVVTLGGSQRIAKAREKPSNGLELHFRPEDPYSHPLSGEVQACSQFLLKISKHNNKGVPAADNTSSPNEINAFPHSQEETQISEEPEDKIHADIVGHVTEAYHFNGMADYQHVLAVHADVARKKKRNWADFEPQFEKHGLIDADQEDLMILLPPVFSLKDTPENVVLKPSMYISLKQKQERVVQHHWEMDIDPSLAIDFNIKDVPKKANWEKFIEQGTDEWKCQLAVCELFNERPIWIKQSLFEHLSTRGVKLSNNMFKRLLFRAAYYFSNGPFLRFWIRKGYDPRKDPESRIFQRIDFRVPPPLRSYCDTGGLKHKWEDLCDFRVFPYKCQTSLQLFELSDDYIKQEIRKPVTQTICTLGTGWFPPHILEMLRLCVAVRFLSVYPNPGAEPFLKSVSLRFEKSKRARTEIKQHIVNKTEHQPVNKDELHNEEEKEIGNDEEEEEEEEEEEDDDDDDVEDENFIAYEGQDMAGDGTTFLQEPSYINGENISKNYLQDLFGSFSHNGGNQDAENSDGEYHIFDQHSDGNDTDDDY